MLTLPGYKIIEKIHDDGNTVIYRGAKEPEQKSVIVKLLKTEYPTLNDLALFKHEYEITNNLNSKGIVKPLALETNKNGIALVLEDFGGESLKKFLSHSKFKFTEFLRLAICLANTLGELHQNNIIHKDIKPSNIIFNQATGQVKITDFAIASLLDKETHNLSNSHLLEGTLAYMSPEQTGRMNRSIDYRTDFYSLGVTFYEMLTGRVPFAATDPIELVHCHIAKTPLPPHHLNSEIPQTISDIVMKLLAKTSEERYQSAWGLKADLEKCLMMLQETGKIEDFPLGRHDLSGQFQIPQKLYGREQEVATLMDAFERVSLGKSEMLLVSGYSGIGKSCLVNEVHKPIVRQRGYFIAGKFDQFKRNIPYISVIQAFQELMRQLLSESQEKIETWKEKLLEALGSNGQVIIDVIPEVELIVGKQPPVPQLGSSELQNRFNLVFKQFIHVFTKKEHPLVLFLDDLQWADSASLKLIQLLMTDPDNQYLLMLGAYRDNEVSATHPLMLTLEEIQACGATVNTITLRPLAIAHVNQLIVETLNCQLQRSKPLAVKTRNFASLLFNKTQGNPFFLTQLLKSLYQEKLLAFDFSIGCWQWDIEQIQRMGITDNVVELMVNKIQKFDKNTQNVLKLAACIGNRFDLVVLAIVNEKSLKATAAELWSALQAGLILPLSDTYKIPQFLDQLDVKISGYESVEVNYKFLHDRVQQAAYALIPESQKKEVHLKVGQLLLQNTNPEEREENIFEIVNHLNIGSELITNQSRRDELAQLNLIAGQKAKAATAMEPAVKYLTVGLELLAEDSWQRHYELTLALYVEAVEAEYLNTNFERSETLAEVVLQHATTLLDRVKVYELKIQLYQIQSQMIKAIDTGFYALEKLGVCLSSSQDDGRAVLELPRLEDLEDIPVMTDLYQLAALRILISMYPPIYIAKPEILPQLILTMVNLCIECGHSPLAAHAYVIYGMFLCGAKGDIESGYHCSQLALKLLEQFNAKQLKAKVYVMFNCHIRFWKEPARHTLAAYLEGFQSGLETGDIEWAGYNAMHYCKSLFLVGEPLESVERQQLPYREFLINNKQYLALDYAVIWRQITLTLIGKTAGKYLLNSHDFDETVMIRHWRESNNHMSLFAAYLAKLILLYLFKNYAQSVAYALLATEHAKAAIGFLSVAAHNFYYSLALLAHYPNVPINEQEQILHQVAINQEKMQHWSDHAPCNFKHKYDLVEAEKARVLRQIVAAMECYDRAIQAAREQGYIQEEALAYELAAEFYLSLGREEIAQTYMTKAHYGYVRWGATAKVQDLETQYPQFFSKIPVRKTTAIDVRTTTSTTGGDTGMLDFTTVMKASQAIASEIVLANLLDKLMKIVIENAGAQTGSLILEKEGQLLIEATATVDKDEVSVQSIALETYARRSPLPMSVINYVERTQENVVLNDATREGIFTTDPYITTNQPKSVLCTPILNQGKLLGILYLENNLTADAFTPDRLEVLKLLCSQAAISIENARLYANLEKATNNLKLANEQLEDYSRTLEQKVEERTLELTEQAVQLKQTLHELKQTQTQLIQTEKMSSLGQMVAGVAHEINNPVNFIYGNLVHVGEYTQNLLNLLHLYAKHYPQPVCEIQDEVEAIELDFLVEDLPKMLSSMQVGTERIRQIVLSLRNFSRLDEAEMKQVNIHQGVDSTLLILANHLKAKPDHPGIQVIKEYGDLPLVECYAGQLNQVFMNILSNAIDALEKSVETDNKQPPKPCIWIRTSVIDSNFVAIRIADNGLGMTEEVRQRLFDPFFTTKPVGKGTGLGLSISYQIVVEKHGGQLKCISAPSQGAEFIIEIPITQSRLCA